MIKVLLVEDQRLFRSGIKLLLDTESDIKVIGMAEDGNEALAKVGKLKPDVVLMDIHMPNLDGITATSKIKHTYPEVKVIFLTANPEEDLIIRGLNVDGDGFLLKELYPDNLVQSIRDAYRGQIVLSGEVAKKIVDKIRELTLDSKQILSKKLENKGIHLTRRQLDVAALFMENKTNKQIAKTVHLSEGTVKNYISELYTELDIHNRNDAINFLNKLLEN